MGIAASVSCDQNILHTFWLIYHKESSLEICFNILMVLQYEQGWAVETTPGFNQRF